MNSKLTNNEFVEILQENKFNEKFNIPKVKSIDNIASATLDFIKKDNKLDNCSLQPLAIILKTYGISIQAYFKFLEEIKEVSFDDKEYKNFLTEGYKSLFKGIEDSNIDDLYKLEYRMKVLELAEKSRLESERNNIDGKKALCKSSNIITVGAMLTTLALGVKYMDYRKDICKQLVSYNKHKETMSTIDTVFKCTSNVVTTIIGIMN